MLDPTTKLFARQVNLTIGMPSGPLSLPFNDANSTGLAVDGLDIEFDVEKSLKSSEPNKARIKVWNLTRDHIKAIGVVSEYYESNFMEGTLTKQTNKIKI